MADEKTTHEVAEKTERDGATRVTETTTTTRREGGTEHRVEDEGKPQQVKPDGR